MSKASDEFVSTGELRLYRYRHGVIPNLISSPLLRNVRSEIQNLSFTPKETDIYRIHQSGDLANLDGLEDSSLKMLPSLLTLRDAMYSSSFRDYLSAITDSGPLSGRKTDMAINIYTPGCHLLCHDDVIGSRRVSYILYLTDPDKTWKQEWGGALRLYPTLTHTGEDGKVSKVPSPDFSVSIPPAFGQLTFFAVQPGESFHDVEEVHSQMGTETEDKDEARLRMAISGWYHIPQKGEEGYTDGLEEQLAEKSTLVQLQSKADSYDLPKDDVKAYYTKAGPSDTQSPSAPQSQGELSLSEKDLNFLLKYIAPTYLTPDTLESVSGIFSDECSLCLESFLSRKFSESLQEYIRSEEARSLPLTTGNIEDSTPWTVARPPHKHRFLFQRAQQAANKVSSPLLDLVEELIPSNSFRKWLSLATDQTITSHDSIARRFRRGQDYTLATGYKEDSPRIEICLGITPTSGWGASEAVVHYTNTHLESNTERNQDPEPATIGEEDDSAVGGYLAYLAGDDDDEPVVSENGGGSDHSVEVPPSLSTGAKSTRTAKPRNLKQDPAIYRASGDEEDDGVLFSMPAGWNRLGIVLRDKGTMRFVKYVSRMAKGDRWDIVGDFGIVEEDTDAEEAETEHGSRAAGLNAEENDFFEEVGAEEGSEQTSSDES